MWRVQSAGVLLLCTYYQILLAVLWQENRLESTGFCGGIAVSVVYFAVIFVAGIWFMGNAPKLSQEVITGVLACIISGMFGGMLAS